MAKWQVNAPNGRNLTINVGGLSDMKYKHGEIVGNEKAAKQFPQYFIPIFDPADIPAHPPIQEKATLEEQLLKEETSKDEKPQMLTEVPKSVEVATEEKEDEVEAGETILVEKKKKGKRK